MADWTTNKDLIQKLYIAFYGRPADPGGLRYWASQLPDNAQPNSEAVRNLIDRFINSPEAESRFGSPSLDAVIDRVINFAFHRDATEADREGVNDVVDLLLKVISVSSGPDFASLNNKLQYANWFVEILDPNGDGIPNDDSTGTKFMATYSGNTDANNVASKLNFIDVSNPATKAMVTDDIKNTVADPGDAIFDQQTGQTFTLTQNADNIVGTGGDDIFVATETTLSSADTLDGKGGNDTLRYASSGNVAINEAGFEIRDIENVQITSDAVGGTTFDFTGAQGVKTIINFNSSNDLIITGLKNLTPTIELRSLGAPNRATNIVDTTIIYDVAATKGTADAVQINVSGNLNTDGSRVGTVTANGVEIFNINSTDSASAFDGIASNTLREMNITGDANLTLNTAFFTNTADVNNVNAKDFEGNLNITLSNSGAANIDVSVTGGKGNDRADFSNGFDKNDAFDGGDGTDTLALTNGVAVVVNPADFGTGSNVEILEITDGGTNVGANVLDMDNFAGVGTVYYSGLNQVFGNGLVGATTIQDTPNTFTVKVNNPNAQNLTVNVKTDGASDELNLQVERVAAGEALNVVTAAKFETVNLDVADDPIVVGTGDLTINQLAINAATTLNITGSANVTINNDGNPATAVLTTLNAGQLTGSLTLTGVDFAKGGATITLGPGNDTINVANAPGADVYDITAGGKDTIRYSAVAQSNKNMDTIKGFTSGEDQLLLSFDANGNVIDWNVNMKDVQGFTSSNQFVGNYPTFAQAQGALTGGKTVSVVFQQDEQILWLDADGNGTLDNNDFRVRLEGVSKVTAADLGFVAGNTVTLTAPAAIVNATTKVNADNFTTNFDDTINSTVANLAGSNVDGLVGNDTLVMSDAGAVTIGAGFQNIENLTLANGTNNVTLVAGTDFKSITGGTGKDTVDVTNLVKGGTVNLGAGDDNLINATEGIITGSQFIGGDGDDTLTFAKGLKNDLDLSKVSGFETVDLGQVDAAGLTVTAFTADTAVRTLKGDTTNGDITVEMTAAQLDALTTITSAAAANTFKIATTDTGAVTVNLADTTYTNVDEITFAASAGVVDVTINENLIDKNLKVTGGTGVSDILRITGNLTSGGAVDLQATGITAFEILNVEVAQNAGKTLTVFNDATTINVSAGGSFVLGTGGDTFNVLATNTATNVTVKDAGGSDTINHAGSGLLTVELTNDNAADTITATGTGALTVNLGVATGKTTITLNSAGVDTINLADGGGGTGLVASANQITVTGFGKANDVIRLDDNQTSAVTLAGNFAVLQTQNASLIGANADLTFDTKNADLLVLNFDMGGSTVVLDGINGGSALLANLVDAGKNLMVAANNDSGYILAYDNGKAYLYAVTDGDGNGNIGAAEIALIGVFNGLNPGDLGVGNFVMAT